jgi:hypothetical protein
LNQDFILRFPRWQDTIGLSACDFSFGLSEAFEAAVQLGDLWFPPGNRLEELNCDREGKYSMRISGQ